MKRFINRFFANEFARGSFILTLSSLFANFLNYVFNTFAGRLLGPAGYGELSALFSYMSIAAVPISVLTTIIIQKISSSNDRLTKALSLETFFYEKIRTSWLIFLPLLLIIPFIPAITNLSKISSVALIPLVLLSFIGSFYLASLQAIRMFSILAGIGIVAAFIKLAGIPLVYLNYYGFQSILFFLILSYIAIWMTGVYVLSGLNKNHNTKVPKIKKSLKELLLNRQFLITTFSLTAITLLNNFDIIFAKKFLPESEVGLYAAWALFAKIIFFVVGPAFSVGFVFFSSSDTKHRQNQTLKLSLIGLTIFGLISFIAYKYFGETIVSIFFGSKYFAITNYLPLAAIFGTVYAMLFFINNYFLSKKHPFSLLLAILMPIYIYFLLTAGSTSQNIIQINIIFSGVVLIGYFAALFKIKKDTQ